MPSDPYTVQLADNAMTTLGDLKVILGIDPQDTNERRDAYLTHMINYVSAWIERQTGRKFKRQIYTQNFKAAGGQELVLPQWPITRVFWIKAPGGDVIPADTYDFSQTGEIGTIWRDQGWPLDGYRGGLAFDMVALKREITVKYVAGYVLPKDATERHPATLPYDLIGVVWKIIQQEYAIEQNNAHGLTAFSISDVSWSFDKTPHDEWMSVIQLYARL